MRTVQRSSRATKNYLIVQCEGELDESSTTKEFLRVRIEGSRKDRLYFSNFEQCLEASEQDASK